MTGTGCSEIFKFLVSPAEVLRRWGDVVFHVILIVIWWVIVLTLPALTSHQGCICVYLSVLLRILQGWGCGNVIDFNWLKKMFNVKICKYWLLKLSSSKSQNIAFSKQIKSLCWAVMKNEDLFEEYLPRPPTTTTTTSSLARQVVQN